MTNGASEESRRGFMNRPIALRWVLILLAIVIVAGLVLWSLESIECAGVRRECDQIISQRTEQSAENVAKTFAVVGNRLVINENWELLQDYADNIVANEPLAYIAVLNTEGEAVVHTNRQLRGQELGPIEEQEGMVAAEVPVMDLTERVGTVRVGMELPERLQAR